MNLAVLWRLINRIIKPQLAIARATLRVGAVHLFVRLSVCLSVCLSVAKIHTKQVYRRRYESLLKCIKTQKNKIWRRTIFNIADGILTPCNVACGSRIVTVNLTSGSTLQCDTWLWDDMPLNSIKRPPYWNSTSDFDFDHITAVDRYVILHQSPKFYRYRTTIGRKK